MPVYKDNKSNRIAGRVGETYGYKAKRKVKSIKKKTVSQVEKDTHSMPDGSKMTGKIHNKLSKTVKPLKK